MAYKAISSMQSDWPEHISIALSGGLHLGRRSPSNGGQCHDGGPLENWLCVNDILIIKHLIKILVIFQSDVP